MEASTRAITRAPEGARHILEFLFLPPFRRWPGKTVSACKPFPFNNFTCCFTLFSKFFSSFHHCTCSLSVSRQYLALDGIYHPLRAAFPNNSTLRRHFTKNRTPRHTGFSPSMTSCSKEHRQGTAPKLPSPNYNSGTEGTRFQI